MRTNGEDAEMIRRAQRGKTRVAADLGTRKIEGVQVQLGEEQKTDGVRWCSHAWTEQGGHWQRSCTTSGMLNGAFRLCMEGIRMV